MNSSELLLLFWLPAFVAGLCVYKSLQGGSVGDILLENVFSFNSFAADLYRLRKLPAAAWENLRDLESVFAIAPNATVEWILIHHRDAGTICTWLLLKEHVLESLGIEFKITYLSISQIYQLLKSALVLRPVAKFDFIGIDPKLRDSTTNFTFGFERNRWI